MLGVGIAIGIGIEIGRLSLKSIPIPNPIPIPMTPVRWHSYTVTQSERNSDICYKRWNGETDFTDTCDIVLSMDDNYAQNHPVSVTAIHGACSGGHGSSPGTLPSRGP